MAVSILQTIAEMEARLAELRQQLVYQGQNQGTSAVRGRIPYAYSHRAPMNPVPLQPPHSHTIYERAPVYPLRGRPRTAPVSSGRVATAAIPAPVGLGVIGSSAPYQTVSLSSILHSQEEVTFQVILRKDENGQPVYATLTAVFDGTQLTVTKSDWVTSMIGTPSAKPGEILYRFIDGLKEGGHLKRTFTVAPWKLCSVVRGDSAVTLEELRRRFLHSASAPVVSDLV
jgi:hypothetical protein